MSNLIGQTRKVQETTSHFEQKVEIWLYFLIQIQIYDQKKKTTTENSLANKGQFHLQTYM